MSASPFDEFQRAPDPFDEFQRATPPVGAVLKTAVQTNPDDMAEAVRLAKRYPAPVDSLYRNLPKVRFAAVADDAADQLATAKALSQYLASRPHVAGMAHDDIPKLKEIESNFAQTAPAAAAQAVLGISEGIWRTPDAAQRAVGYLASTVEKTGLPPYLNPIRGVQDVLQFISEGRLPVGPKLMAGTTDVADRISGAQEILTDRATFGNAFADVQTLAKNADQALATAVQTGNLEQVGQVLTDPNYWSAFMAQAVPSLYLAMKSGGSVAFMGWLEGMEQASNAAEFEKRTGIKVTDQEFTQAFAQTAIVNALLERYGLDKVLGAKGNGLKGLAKAMAAEGGTEGLQQINSNLAALLAYNQEQGLTEGVLASVMGGVASGGGVSAAQQGAQQVQALMERQQQQARAAAEDAGRLQQLLGAAGQSLLRERSPEDFRAYVQTLGDKPLYVDGEVLNQLPAEVLNQLPESVREQIADAAATGDTVEIPMADVLTIAPGTPLEQVLNEHARMDPFASSKAEVAAAQDVLKQEAERVIQQAADAQVAQQEFDTVKAMYAEQITATGRYRPAVAEQMGTWIASFYTAYGSRVGMTPTQFQQRYPLRILGAPSAEQGEVMDQPAPEALAEAAALEAEARQIQLAVRARTKAERAAGAEQISDATLAANRADGDRAFALLTRAQELRRPPAVVREAKTPRWFAEMADTQRAAVDALPEWGGADGFSLRRPGESAEDDVFTSASSNFTDSEVVPGVRSVPLEKLGGLGGYDDAREQKRITALAERMRGDKEITPIFVGVDETGDLFIMEGQHRARAFKAMGMQAIPAKIVVDFSGGRYEQNTEQIKSATGNLDQPGNPAFDAWFGDSKVVDAEGKPLVVYHGSRARFTEFSKEKIGKQTDSGYLGAGFYFGDRRHAGMYAGMTPEAARNQAEDREWQGDAFVPVGARSALYPVFLSLKNPLVLQEMRDPDSPRRTLDREKHVRDTLGLPRTATAAEVTAAAEAAGYDGVVFEYERGDPNSPWPLDREYVAFRPEQIKSATGNNGNFDPQNPSILEQSAYHGTPHRGIDKFTTDKIGTGEGFQAFGWGLYFTNKREIAEGYREKLTEKNAATGLVTEVDGKSLKDYLAGVEVSHPLVRVRVSGALRDKRTVAQAKAMAEAARAKFEASNPPAAEKTNAIYAEVQKVLDGLAGAEITYKEPDRGQLYEVELPDDENLLLWDKPLGQQPEKVRKALKDSGLAKELKDNLSDYSSPMDTRGKLLGENIYAYLQWKLGSDKAASERLRGLGVLGTNYPAGTIAGNKNSRARNYVVFSGDDVQIRNQFYQNAPTPRGTFNPRSLEIVLNPNANLSTFFHETGHFFLEVMADIASQPNPPAQIAEDMATFLKWAGITGDETVGGVDSGAPLAQSSKLTNDKTVYWHGSVSLDLRGGNEGLHLGTKLAAMQALEARIGVPAEGTWDGTREYGKTLLAGRKTLGRLEKERGYYLRTGLNAGGPNNPVPEEDYYPTPGTLKYADGTLVPMTMRPDIKPFRLKTEMSNSRSNPYEDFKANGYMRGALKKGNAKRGYYYGNIAEDAGSISVVVPNGDHVEPVDPAALAQDGPQATSTQPLPKRRTPLETWNAMTLDQKRPYHERWAESIEQYVMEGKAPSVELQPLMRRFAAWLKSVYGSIKQFLAQRGVPVGGGDALNQVDPVAQAQAEGYEGADTGEAAEWLAAKAKGLDMSEAARMERARAMGFDTSKKLYHSTLTDTKQFEPVGKFMGFTGTSGISVTDSPEMASRYLDRYGEYGWVDGKPNQAFSKNVIPVFIKPGKVLERDEPFPLPRGMTLGSPLPEGYVPAHKAMGYDTLIRNDAISRKGEVKHSTAKNAIKGKEYVLTAPSQVRSIFAAFDPDNAASGNLLAQGNQPTGPQMALNDDIRRVMDRMLATDEQIQQANEVAGLVPDETADGVAEERLRKRSIADLKWAVKARDAVIAKLKKEARAIEKRIREEVTAEVNQMPEVQAKEMLAKTRKENGGEINDTERAIIADAFSYESVDAMLKAIDAFGSKKDVIDGMTEQRMLEEHGDLVDERAIQEAANEAVHNEARARSLATELRTQAEMLGARSDTGQTNAKGSKITVNALVEAAKQFAANVVSKTALRDLKARAWQHTAAERRAAKRWTEATAAGKTEEAVKAKQDQMLNHAAAKAAIDAKNEAQKILDFFRRVAKGNNETVVEKGRDPDIVNTARAVLAAYGVETPTTKAAAEYLDTLKANDPDTFSAVEPMMVEAMQNAQPLDALTFDQLLGLHEQVEAMWHLAKRSRQMEVDGDLMDVEDVADEVYAKLEEIGIPDTIPGESGAVTDREQNVRRLQFARALLRRVEQWAEGLDGKFGGPLLRYIFQPVKDAGDRYRADRLRYRKKFQALVDNVAPLMTHQLIAAPELGYTFGKGHNGIGHAELLHAILHTGNESNKRKLLLGRGWASENADGTLDTSKWDAFTARLANEGVLQPAHYDFAQGVWDLLEETKPLAQKTHRDVFGRYFAEVTADAFVDPFGVTRSGGYVPAQADPEIVADADIRALAEMENESMAYSFPSPGKGFTKSRVEYNRPLKLDLRTIPQHIDKVLLFSHMTPAVRGVTKLLRQKKVSQPLGRIDPAAYSGMLLPWLNRSARQQVETPIVGDGRIAKVLTAIRNRAGAALMFANVSNTIQQITGLSGAAIKVRPALLVKSAAAFISAPRQTAAAVAAASPYMADRMTNEVAAMNDEMEKILLNPSAYERAQSWTRRHAYFLQSAFDNTLSPIVWTGAYNQALEDGLDPRMAVRFADGVVRQTQGTTLPEDVSRIESGPPYARVFTQFVSYFNMMANTNGTALQQIAREVGLKKGAGKALYVVTLGMLVPLWTAEAIAQAFRGGPDDEDDDGYLDDWLAAVFGMGTIKGVLAQVPFIGQLANAGLNRLNNNPADDKVSLSPAVSLLEASVGAPVSVYKAIVEDGNQQKAIRDVASLVSIATGLPATAVARPIGYAAGVAQGKIEPTGPVDAARGLVTGVASPASK